MLIEVAFLIAQIYANSNIALQMFISNLGLQIIADFLDLDYTENKDIISFSIDSIYVLYNTNNPGQQANFPLDDISLLLSKMGIIEKVSRAIPHIITSVETNTEFSEHSASQRFLEKAFDILQQILQAQSIEVKMAFCQETVLIECFTKIIHQTISDPTMITLTIVKRFLKLAQLLSQSPQIFEV